MSATRLGDFFQANYSCYVYSYFSFHLECLAPPLDRVPDGEWFCQDCFSLNSPSGAVIIDEEMSSIPPELEHVSGNL